MQSLYTICIFMLSMQFGSGFLSSGILKSNQLNTKQTHNNDRMRQLYSSNEIERTFASYIIYKSKAAVSLKIIPPTFQAVGSNGKSRNVAREGGLLFEFANTMGPREYDWSKKGVFLMAAAECGELLLLDKTAPGPGLEFFHDPNMGGASAGQITKKLKITTAPDGKGVYINLNVNDKSASSMSYAVPVSWGELQVFKSIADYSIPRILGFDKVW
eukprot:CAMPEP_0119038074 /NCGR_PEP_ID=MMETSP1177-20130426/6776_1 /TAXON_ID=2985 /ORGANISM="Ochromonas sp, Strain CCMP1899" /LENGTH=214 /DNA_ID=CAMNT_0007000177 /DNA_START=84 /DNA_END=725 /DNA_ORIENTATION=-